MVQLNLIVSSVTLYARSVTGGGLFPLGGFGGPFLPQPAVINVPASQIIAIRAMVVAACIFTGEWLIKLPTPSPGKPELKIDEFVISRIHHVFSVSCLVFGATFLIR